MFKAVSPTAYTILFIGGIAALSLVTAGLSLFSSAILFVCSALGLLPLLTYCSSWIPSPDNLHKSLQLNGSLDRSVAIWYPNTVLQNHYFYNQTESAIPGFLSYSAMRPFFEWLRLVPSTFEDLKRVLDREGSVSTSVPTEEIWRFVLTTGTSIVPVLSTPLTLRELVGSLWTPPVPRISQVGTPIPVSRLEQVTDADIVALRSKYETGLQNLLESTREDGQNTEKQQQNES
uniref:Uncharacterized protein n=1 Tax=viral metagenome TaxID=1070528 RepID=A0A6C0K4V6_9ZZZZ